jgi:ABC-2 type transport system permease protein
MNAVRAIIWKERRSFLRKRLQLGIIVLSTSFFGVLLLLRLGSVAFSITAAVVVFMGAPYFSWMSFQEEQLNKTISSLLASPIEVSQFFLGKILAIFIFTYLLELVALVISGSIMWFKLGELPSSSALLWALVTIPIWGIVLTELLGLAYILFGNPSIMLFVALALVMFIGIIFNPANQALASRIYALFSSPIMPAAFGIGIALLLYILAGRISKERMRKVKPSLWEGFSW